MEAQRTAATVGAAAGSGRFALRRLTSGLPSLPLAVWILLFVCVPGGFMVAYSFMTYTWFEVELPLTLENYAGLVQAAAYGKLLAKTFMIAFVVTAVTLVIASPFVYYIARVASRPVAVGLLLLTVLPLWMNTIVRNYSWMPMVANKGIINRVLEAMGFPGFSMLFTLEIVIIVGISLALPFAVLVLYATMTGISHEVEEASFDMGSGRFDSFRKVILPLTASGYQTATLFIFLPTLAFYVTPLMLGGKEGVMIATALMPIIKESLNFATGSAFVAPLIMVLVLMVMLLRRGINLENLYKGRDRLPDFATGAAQDPWTGCIRRVHSAVHLFADVQSRLLLLHGEPRRHVPHPGRYFGLVQGTLRGQLHDTCA